MRYLIIVSGFSGEDRPFFYSHLIDYVIPLWTGRATHYSPDFEDYHFPEYSDFLSAFPDSVC
jgi:hypothetical protein